jgi:hypothetical protein
MDALIDGKVNLLSKLDEDGRITERDDPGFSLHLVAEILPGIKEADL